MLEKLNGTQSAQSWVPNHRRAISSLWQTHAGAVRPSRRAGLLMSVSCAWPSLHSGPGQLAMMLAIYLKDTPSILLLFRHKAQPPPDTLSSDIIIMIKTDLWKRKQKGKPRTYDTEAPYMLPLTPNRLQQDTNWPNLIVQIRYLISLYDLWWKKLQKTHDFWDVTLSRGTRITRRLGRSKCLRLQIPQQHRCENVKSRTNCHYRYSSTYKQDTFWTLGRKSKTRDGVEHAGSGTSGGIQISCFSNTKQTRQMSSQLQALW